MLEDVKVLDLSRVLAGPYCTQLLADLGAQVWKVEPPRGDDTRHWGPPFVGGESGYYLSVNRNKEGLAVDLKQERGRDLVLELARRADVIVENFKTGDLARYGLDFESVAAVNKRVVYASITGYGQNGPRARDPGYDAALQAISGLMHMTGEEGGGPVKLAVAWVDVLAGVHTAAGILAALYERDRTGVGKRIDMSLFDVALASMVNQGQNALLTGNAPRRMGSAHPNIVPYQAFPTATGDIALAVGNDGQFERLCREMGLSRLLGSSRFDTNDQRVANRDELIEILSAEFRRQPREKWLERLKVAGVPAAPVNSLPEALVDIQVDARGMVGEVDHPLVGPLKMIMSPFGSLAEGAVRPPPLLGQHNADVLQRELGLSEAQVLELERDGVLRGPEAPAAGLHR